MTLLELRVQFIAQRIELFALELRDGHAAPSLTDTYQRGVHQLHHRALAEGMRDDFGAPPLFTERPLQQIRGAGHASMRNRQAKMRDARLEVGAKPVRSASP